MNELTKEYFDQQIGSLQSDVDKRFDAIEKKIKDGETGVGVLFENIDDKLGLIIESQTGIRDDIKTMKSEYRHLDDRVTKTEIRLDVIEAR